MVDIAIPICKNEFMFGIGDVIAKEREKLGLTQVELAVKCHMRPNTLSDLERGKKKSRIETLEKAAAGLDQSVGQLYLELENAKSKSVQSAYQDQTHQRLHNLLQEMLELGDGYTEKAQFAIECVYSKLTEESRTRSGPKRARRAATG